MGSRVLATLPSARAAAIQLFAIGSMSIADQSIALTVRAVYGDGDHERLLFFLLNWSSQSTISCLFVPLPIASHPLFQLLPQRPHKPGKSLLFRHSISSVHPYTGTETVHGISTCPRLDGRIMILLSAQTATGLRSDLIQNIE